jgi:hypothetical protein
MYFAAAAAAAAALLIPLSLLSPHFCFAAPGSPVKAGGLEPACGYAGAVTEWLRLEQRVPAPPPVVKAQGKEQEASEKSLSDSLSEGGKEQAASATADADKPAENTSTVDSAMPAPLT